MARWSICAGSSTNPKSPSGIRSTRGSLDDSRSDQVRRIVQEVRVGLIGFGAIGREVAEAIHAGRAGRSRLVSVLVRSPEKIEPDCATRLGCRFTTDAADFLDSAMDLVIEA